MLTDAECDAIARTVTWIVDADDWRNRDRAMIRAGAASRCPPREPTQAMQMAGLDVCPMQRDKIKPHAMATIWTSEIADIWRAMHDAAQQEKRENAALRDAGEWSRMVEAAAAKMLAELNGDAALVDARRWRYGVEHGFPTHCLTPRREPTHYWTHHSFRAAMYPSAEAAIDAAIAQESVPANVPYPEFCRHPDKCAGLSSCPRDPCCCD